MADRGTGGSTRGVMNTTPTNPASGSQDPNGARASLAIETAGLTKRYGSRTVVDGLDLEVPAGVIAGFVGPNGAGKSNMGF
jgi:ABC-2 type transport system ATP-binding protein